MQAIQFRTALKPYVDAYDPTVGHKQAANTWFVLSFSLWTRQVDTKVLSLSTSRLLRLPQSRLCLNAKVRVSKPKAQPKPRVYVLSCLFCGVVVAVETDVTAIPRPPISPDTTVLNMHRAGVMVAYRKEKKRERGCVSHSEGGIKKKKAEVGICKR